MSNQKKLIKDAFLGRKNLELVLRVVDQPLEDCIYPQVGDRYSVRPYGLTTPTSDLEADQQPEVMPQTVVVPVRADGYKLAGIRPCWYGSWTSPAPKFPSNARKNLALKRAKFEEDGSILVEVF